MGRRRLRISLLVVLTGASLAVFATATALEPPLPPLPVDPFWLVWTGFSVVGALILARRPENRVGLTLFLIGVCAALSSLTAVLYQLGVSPEIPLLVNQVAFAPIFFLFPLLILVFPEGHLPSRRWRPYVRAAVIAVVVLMIWLLLRPVEYSIDAVTFHANPIGVAALAPFDSWVLGVLRLALAGFAVAVLVDAVRRYRRADAIGRLQVKWVITPALFMPVLFTIGAFVEEAEGLKELGSLLITIAIVGGGNAISAGIGVAVFRHRLYGIDKFVSRTVTYALVISILGAAFFVLVTGLTSFVPFDEPLVIAISTLAVATSFNPVLKGLRRMVERRFNRSRHDSEMVFAAFSNSLRDRVDPGSLVDDWVAVVEDTMQPATVGIWVRGRDGI